MTMWSSFAILNLLLVVGAVDGLYLHLWRFRLFARPESRFEHALHTVRALLIPPTIWLLFVEPTPHLVAAGALVALDQIAMIVDIWVEPRSRRNLGGVPRSELLVHFTAVSLHATALALAFVGRAGGAALPPAMASMAIGAVVTGSLTAVVHLALLPPAAARFSTVEPALSDR